MTVAVTDLLVGAAVISLAAAAIGAVLEYCAAAIHHDHHDHHKKG